MAAKYRWQVIDVDALDQVFNCLDKVNVSAIRGLINEQEKGLLLGALKSEVTAMLVQGEKNLEAPESVPEQPDDAAAARNTGPHKKR